MIAFDFRESKVALIFLSKLQQSFELQFILNLFQNILVALLNADFLARTFDWQTAKIGHVWFVDV